MSDGCENWNAVNDLAITYQPVSKLKPYARNARTHSRAQIKQIADLMERFGFTNPILIDDEDRIIAGHGRAAAAKLLGIQEVPTVRLAHLSPAEKRAYILADNRLAEKAGWDKEILAIELQWLIDEDFAVDLTGFNMAEIDVILEDAEDAKREASGPENEIPEPLPGPAVSRLGDRWTLGGHGLLCADAREDSSYVRLLEGSKAEMVFTDAPFNVRIQGHVCGLGRIHHPEFAMASGEMSQEEYTRFLGTVFGSLARHTVDGSIHYHCMDWRHLEEIQTAGKQHGRHRTNVWDYPGVNTMRAGRLEELAMHPTVKPVALIADAIRDCSKRGGLVLDPFCGSGTTLIAAERTGRKARALEIDPIYVDVAVRRWQTYTGKPALLAPNNESFELVAERRMSEHAAADFADTRPE